MDLDTVQIIQVTIAAILVGFSKTGVTGLGLIIVPLMASAFPAKASTGVLLPMLLFADLFAVGRYRRYTQWRLLGRLFPWVVPGIVLGYFALWRLPSERLAWLLAVMVLGLVVLRVVMARAGERIEA
ncbi:unnamed protein product, partial [marine sediment metagenome]